MSTGEDVADTGAPPKRAGVAAFTAEQLALIDQIVAARPCGCVDRSPDDQRDRSARLVAINVR